MKTPRWPWFEILINVEIAKLIRCEQRLQELQWP